MNDEELELLLSECLEEVIGSHSRFAPDPKERYSDTDSNPTGPQGPDPSELPLPKFLISPIGVGNIQNFVLIISKDKMSNMMLELLKPNLDKFEIKLVNSDYNLYEDRINPLKHCVNITGFPTVYDRTTKKTHLGVTCYKSLINFFKEL